MTLVHLHMLSEIHIINFSHLWDFLSAKITFDIAESINFQLIMFYCIISKYLECYLQIFKKLQENSNFIYAKLTFKECTLFWDGPYVNCYTHFSIIIKIKIGPFFLHIPMIFCAKNPFFTQNLETLQFTKNAVWRTINEIFIFNSQTLALHFLRSQFFYY